MAKPLRLSAKMDVQHANAQKNVTAGKLQKWPNCCTCRQKWTRQAKNVQKVTHEKWPNHRTGAEKLARGKVGMDEKKGNNFGT